jgi:hypothetical protein
VRSRVIGQVFSPSNQNRPPVPLLGIAAGDLIHIDQVQYAEGTDIDLASIQFELDSEDIGNIDCRSCS